MMPMFCMLISISIHAPLRERLSIFNYSSLIIKISIHAPLRERPGNQIAIVRAFAFQSMLPYGSDMPKPTSRRPSL